ncbi:MAG TPA: PqiC family protein [Myxococcota bacterium]|nr:PqiC family protein [Myxococcota bacterium]
MTARACRVFALAASAALMAACRLPRESPSPRFWVLTPMEGSVSDGPIQRTVGVGPVLLPAYLDRAAVVTRAGPRLDVASFDLWGQPLSENVTAVLGRNLEIQLPGTAVQLFPWTVAPSELDRRVTVQVSRFEADADGSVHLDASWELRRGSGAKLLASGRAAIREPVAGDRGVAETTPAMSRALAELSRQIAAQLAAG